MDDCIQMLQVGNVKLDVVINGDQLKADRNLLCAQNLSFFFSNLYYLGMMPTFQSNMTCRWG